MKTISPCFSTLPLQFVHWPQPQLGLQDRKSRSMWAIKQIINHNSTIYMPILVFLVLFSSVDFIVLSRIRKGQKDCSFWLRQLSAYRWWLPGIDSGFYLGSKVRKVVFWCMTEATPWETQYNPAQYHHLLWPQWYNIEIESPVKHYRHHGSEPCSRNARLPNEVSDVTLTVMLHTWSE